MKISKRGYLHIHHTHLHVLCFTDQIPSAFQFHVARALTRKRCETNEAYASYEQANGNCGWNRPHAWNNPSSGNEHTSKRANWAEEEVDAAAIRIVQRGGRRRRLQQRARRASLSQLGSVFANPLSPLRTFGLFCCGGVTQPHRVRAALRLFGKAALGNSDPVCVSRCDMRPNYLFFKLFLLFEEAMLPLLQTANGF